MPAGHFGIDECRRVFQWIRSQPDSANLAKQLTASVAEIDFMGYKLKKMQPTHSENLRMLILLVKYWFKTEVKAKQVVDFKSYVLELVCLDTWEKKLQSPTVNLPACFQAVLRELVDFGRIRYLWTDKYERADVLSPLFAQSPLIVDPEDPWRNIANEVDWLPVREAAAKALDSLSRL